MKNVRNRGSRLDAAAKEIGTTLGHLATRMDAWRRQRDEIAAEVRQAVDVGRKMLAELGSDVAGLSREVGLTKRRGGRKKGFKMSEEAKAKIAEAARKRWAARKKAAR
jgi:hypothetical protein